MDEEAVGSFHRPLRRPAGAEQPRRESSGATGTARPAIRLSFPGDATCLEIPRSVVGRACRLAGFSYDGIEDFAMAVHEAATILIESCPSDVSLDMTGVDPSGRLEVSLLAREPTKALSVADLRAGYRWDVLEALCEKVWWQEVGTAIGLSQTVR